MSELSSERPNATLWKIFENVNRWLEYAEKKNGLLLTILSLQLALIKLYVDHNAPNWAFYGSVIGLTFSLILAVFSFFPQLEIPDWLYFWSPTAREKKPADNLLFFGDIAKYSQSEFIKSMETYAGMGSSIESIDSDLCGQIIVNSRITNRKFRLFKFAIWAMLFGQFLFGLSFFCHGGFLCQNQVNTSKNANQK